MKEIYLAILNDRHFDPQHHAYDKVEDAIAHCRKWMKEYTEQRDWYEWTEETIRGWEFYARTFDTGPRVYVEKIKYGKVTQ